MASTEAADALRTLAKRPAVVTIDLHRGHLDPEVATLPLPADNAAALVDRAVPLLDAYRELGVPIVHVITAYRNRDEILDNAYWRFQADRRGSSRAAVAEHNLEGMPGLELMPGIGRDGDAIVRTKQRYDCFVGTDLDFVLRSHGVNTLYVTGVNTNSCVLSTVAAACSRDYAVVVVEDCVDTMDGPALHDAALACIRTAFGFVMTADEIQPAPVAA
jgi:biuret amidohydrolase